MHKINIANILITRTCNLRCSYCNIVKNYKGMPYKRMSEYKEMTSLNWIDLISRLHANNPDIFLILYGGEIFLYPHLEDILRYCNSEKINYTLISNNTDMVRPKIYELFEKLGPYRGFTSSVDPIAFMSDIPSELCDIRLKSRNGLDNLAKMKTDGIAHDVVAEITAMKMSLPYLYHTVKFLSDKNIWSSITVVDDQKSKYYDFSNVKSSDGSMLEQNNEIRTVFDNLISGYEKKELKIHIPYLLNDLYDILPSNMYCDIYKDVHNVSIEPDGSFRLCLRVKGIETPKLSYENVINSSGVLSDEFVNNLTSDYKKYCLGCNWTCMFMSNDKHKDKIINH